jgi:acyl-[acyl-carrier-protein]-phospholipid O-acyltransferase/long-chain-fatty-acid--[acyl-carrier-protein] ligase
MTADSPRPLLRSARFLPLFVTQTLGAMNDNLFKNALAVMILFTATGGGAPLVALSGGLFILPYAFLSATAGQVADKYDKARMLRLTKLWEAAIMLVAAVGFLIGSVPLLMAVLAGLGVQAAFFSPLKFGILPQHLAETELISGNALIEAGTFAGILVGTIAGGILILLPHGPVLMAAAGLVVAVAGVLAAYRIPPAVPEAPELRIEPNILRETGVLVRHAKTNQAIWLSILGISWFWTIGAVLLAEFPVVVKETLHGTGSVATLFLTVFAVGVGAGSILIGKLLKGEVSARHVPLAAIGISLFAWDFARSCAAAGVLPSMRDVLTHAEGLRALGDLFLLALCGGIYSVPLYTIIQEHAAPAERARMIAANNIVNAGFMVAGAVLAAVLAGAGMSAPAIIMIMAAANLAVAVYICSLLPQDILRMALRWYFDTFHGVDVQGMEHYRAAGVRSVVVSNHLSFLDGCLLAAYVPDVPTFAVNTHITKRWWAKPFLAPIDVFAVDPANPFAAKSMIKAVKGGKRLVIFPEGRLTTTGALMKIYEGAGLVADKSGAKLVPIRIDGLQFTPFSRLKGKLRRRWFPRLSITVLPAVELAVDPALRGRRHRQAVGTALQDIMVNTVFATQDTRRSLFAGLLDARALYGGKLPIAEDLERVPVSYDRLVLGAVILGRKLAAETIEGERVGMLLPNSVGALVGFMALQAFARVPTMLNFSTGTDSMVSGLKAAEIRTIVTSRRFVERGRLDAVIEVLARHARIVWLEDIRASLTRADKLRGLQDRLLARRLPGARVTADNPAVVLFTSGSEGTPKGVVLSHRNLLSNWAQLSSVIDHNPSDRVMNALPMFHSFGLTGGTLLPLLSGVRIFFYPSPLHYKIVPEVIYDTDATIIFGTDTFLAGWARFAHAYDFYAVRYAFAGAEKVRDETKRLYAERFGVRVLEGYGVTETAPALAINTAMHAKSGTVGRLLPGIEHRLEPVPGIEEGGRLHVRGPNVMLGYLKADAPGVLQPPEEGWYDTGDIVSLDDEKFVTIRGRAKRFAKLGGEMVSMAAAETLAATLWPDSGHAVTALPDPRKGEQLILLTTEQGAMAQNLLAHARARGVAEIMVPRVIQVVEAIPLLGTGKTDYPKVAELAKALSDATSDARQPVA